MLWLCLQLLSFLCLLPQQLFPAHIFLNQAICQAFNQIIICVSVLFNITVARCICFGDIKFNVYDWMFMQLFSPRWIHFQVFTQFSQMLMRVLGTQHNHATYHLQQQCNNYLNVCRMISYGSTSSSWNWTKSSLSFIHCCAANNISCFFLYVH